ncbi:coadhesin-like isoform X2 [Rhopilema esculentum]|uniref:coadhesin-like isoform X2 n=1 Tax=Rhopilema esculentum TaxID=499914 RepID=UPI0031CFC440
MADQLTYTVASTFSTIFILLLIICSAQGKEDSVKAKADEKEHEPGIQTKELSKAKEPVGQTTSKFKADTAQASNNGSKQEDWSTAPAENILFPETYLSSIKRVLENTSMQSNSSQPITKNGLGGQCSKAVDLIFLLDSSESVKYENWNQVLTFVKHLCDRFSLSLTRLAIIRYDSEAEIALPLTHFPDTLSRDLAIDNIYYKTGGTRTDVALEKCIEMLHTVERRKASQVLILVTDGPSNKLEINRNNFVEGKDLVHAPAQLLKEEGVALFAIGIEPDSQTPKERTDMKEELQVIASDPVKSHIFVADGYRELERKVVSISKAACVVNGGWSLWSEYSPCSVTCGSGTKVRMRTCTNPVPENNGAECTGVRVETQSCDMGPCSALSSQVGQILKLYSTGTTSPLAPGQSTSSGVTQNGQQNVVEESQLSSKKSACPGGYEEIPVQDDQLTASSVFAGNKTEHDSEREYAATNSRINNSVNKGSWCAGQNVTAPMDSQNQFLQIDLKKTDLIGMIATQGSHSMDRWVKSYFLRYSEDGSHWNFYNNKTALTGNTDRDGVVKTTLNPPVRGRFFQINPQEWNEENSNQSLPNICLRTGVFRCNVKEIQKRNIVPGKTRRVHMHITKHRGQELTRRSPFNVSNGAKRILNKLRRMAKHIVKKMKNRAGSVPLG